MPAEISPHPFHPQEDFSFCLGSAWEELQNSRGRKPTDTLFELCFGHDIPLARKTRNQLQELDCDENVFVIVAHDASVRDRVDHFPKSLNDWKEKNWAKDVKWTFLRDLEPYWQSQGVGKPSTNLVSE